MADSTTSAARAATPARTSSNSSDSSSGRTDAAALAENPTPAFYAVIPADVRYHPDLPPNAKLLYGEITALCSREGYCWAQNPYFADLYRTHRVTISKWIRALADAGFIRVEIDKQAGNLRRIYLVAKSPIPISENANSSKQKDFKAISKNATHSITRSITKKNTKNPEVLPSASGEQTPAKPPDRNGSGGAARDPLAELAAAEYEALEQRAREKVIAELGPPICDLARRGKAMRDVKAMMRALLAASVPQDFGTGHTADVKAAGIIQSLDARRLSSLQTDHLC